MTHGGWSSCRRPSSSPRRSWRRSWNCLSTRQVRAAAAAQASGSRKRAREQERSHEEIIAELDHELLAATKW
eukprot:1842145-Prymnesium_polylepis.1